MAITNRSTGPASRVRAYHRSLARACVVCLLALATLPGCTNNLLKTATSLINAAGGDPLAGVGGNGGNTSGLTLSSVMLDTFSPTSTLDLLGDGSGAMGSSCSAKSGGGAASGATTCTCAFSYVQSNGVQIGPVEIDTTYHENNMLRCPYTVVPSGVSYVNIYIHLTNSDTRSNTVTLKLGAGGGSGIDLSNPLSFSKTDRFQCRDIVFVPYLWDGSNMYDPFVSEDPRYSYPLNFYTTNMGLTFSLYASDSNAVGWNCPALPNDTASGMDLTLYSVAADSSGSKSIFPPKGSFDRSTFYVANAQAGIFNIPVNAYTYPTAVTAAVAVTGGVGAAGAGAGGGQQPPPLGYAASPIPVSSGGETCPDSSVVIPANYHWAKLWLFRKQLPQRAYPVSNNLATFGSSAIACNSPKWSTSPVPAAPKNTVFTDCSGHSSWDALNSSQLAARFSLATGQCFDITPGGATNSATGTNWDATATNSCNVTATCASVNFTSYALGSDIWAPAKADSVSGCGGTASSDISHACQSSTGNVPWDSNGLGQGLIDPTTANSRVDYLFVVSPISVNRQDMLPTSSSTIHSIYTPVRFMSPTDCKSSDPDMPTFPGDCSATRLLSYGITVAQAGTGGQLGSKDPNEPGQFPMCVLQPN